MGAAGSSTAHAPQDALRQHGLRLPEACPPERVARLCAALRDVGMPPAAVQASAQGDLILLDPTLYPLLDPHAAAHLPHAAAAGARAVRPQGQLPGGQQLGEQLGDQLGDAAAAAAAAAAPESVLRTESARAVGVHAPESPHLPLVHAHTTSLAYHGHRRRSAPERLQSRPPPSADADGVSFKYDVFVSHCKRLDASEDRAMWVVDAAQGAGLRAFFDRLDLLEINEEVLEEAVRSSRVLVTIIDPYTFESEWVVKENAWAEQYGRPIITLYDGDRHRWDQLKKWLQLHPHVFRRQAIPYSKDYRVESKAKLILQIERAMRAPEEGKREPAHGASGAPAPSRRLAPASRTCATMLSKVRVAVGKSQLPASDTAAAAGAAWRQLLSKLGPNPEPHLLICGYDGYHDAELLLATLRGLCGDRCSVIGSSCGGGMIVEGVYVTGPCIAIMGIVDPEGSYDVCFAASGEGAEERVRASIAAANAEATASPVATCPSSSAHAPASSSASSSSPPFSICLSTSLFTGVHADELIAGAEAALGRSCSLFGGAPLPFNSAGAQSPDVAASRVFASARAGSDGRPPSMHVGQGVVLALCRPSVHAASAFTSATTPMQCRGKITKLIEGNSTFPGAEMLPVTCIAEIDGRRAFDMYAEWMRDTEWHDEFNGVVAQAKAQADAKGNRNGAMDWFGLDSINNGDGSGGGVDDDAARERRGTFGVMHGFGLGVMHPTCCAAKGCEGEDFKHFSILGWGPEGEAFTLPGVTPKLGQTVTIMDCPGGMVGARAHTSTVAAKLLHEQGFEVNLIRGAFTFCCGANLQLEGGQGCADLAEKLGDVLGWAPLLGFIGGPELGRMPHGGSEFGTFMYGVVVWSDREQGTSA